MNNTSWASDGNHYYQIKTNSLVEKLPFAVYKLNFSPTEGFSLEKIEDYFALPKKLYGMERPFIEWMKKTYANTTDNLGIKLEGLKGTGKSITSKILANELGLPIILMETNYGAGMVDYLAGIQQDVVLFADEYEKVFKAQKETDYNDREEDSTLLTLMDGVRKTEHRKVFLLTTNAAEMHDAMKQRPGRLRYIKNFGNLSREVIEEIVDDMLIHKNLRDVTIQFIAKLEQITLDIVTSLITEVNIHQVDPESFGDIFNVVKVEPMYDVILITDEKEITVAFSQKNLDSFADGNMFISQDFITKGTHIGDVASIDEDGSFTIATPEHYLGRVKQAMPAGADHLGKKNRFRVERVQGWHKSYIGAF